MGGEVSNTYIYNLFIKICYDVLERKLQKETKMLGKAIRTFLYISFILIGHGASAMDGTTPAYPGDGKCYALYGKADCITWDSDYPQICKAYSDKPVTGGWTKFDEIYADAAACADHATKNLSTLPKSEHTTFCKNEGWCFEWKLVASCLCTRPDDPSSCHNAHKGQCNPFFSQ